jgi:hypothetical protein
MQSRIRQSLVVLLITLTVILILAVGSIVVVGSLHGH